MGPAVNILKETEKIGQRFKIKQQEMLQKYTVASKMIADFHENVNM